MQQFVQTGVESRSYVQRPTSNTSRCASAFHWRWNKALQERKMWQQPGHDWSEYLDFGEMIKRHRRRAAHGRHLTQREVSMLSVLSMLPVLSMALMV